MKSPFLLQLLDHSVTIGSFYFGSKVSSTSRSVFIEEVCVSFDSHCSTVQHREASHLITLNGDQFQAQH